MLTWINDRRTALLAALAALVSTLLAARQGDEPSGVYVWLVAVGAGLAAYLAAYAAIGLTEKLLVGTAAAVVGSIAAGILAGTDVTELALSTVLVILGKLGVESALPSQAGSVALRSAEYTLD